MVKGGLTAVVTPLESVYRRLRIDPIVSTKSHLIASRAGLANTMHAILAAWDNDSLLPGQRSQHRPVQADRLQQAEY